MCESGERPCNKTFREATKTPALKVITDAATGEAHPTGPSKPRE